MRTVIIALILLITWQTTYAQTGLLRCKLIYGIPDTLHRTVEVHELFFNSIESMDEPGTVTRLNATDTMRIVNSTGESRRRIVYKNRQTNQLLSRERAFGEQIILSDTLRPVNWKLLPGTRKIGGYMCNSASGKFAGRDYTVWYTPAVPISDGIWKFYGLPGLILEAVDNEHRCMFLFESLDIPAQTNPLTGRSPFDGSQRRLSHNEFVILRRSNLDSYNKLHSSPNMVTTITLNSIDVFETR